MNKRSLNGHGQPSYPIPPRNIYETLDVLGIFVGTQIMHGHQRRSRVGNHRRDDVTVFRFKVSDHHVDVYDIRLEVPVGVLPRRFVATTEVQIL